MKTGYIMLLTSLSISASGIFIPNIAREFGASHFTISMIVVAYNLSSFIAYYIFGRASDLYGRRLFIKIGLLASILTFAMQALSDSNMMLVITRVMAGFTVGIFPAALTAYIFEKKKNLGKFSSYGSLGWALGAVMAGVVAYYKQIFLLSSLAFVIAFAVSLMLSKGPEKKIHVPLFPKDVIKRNLRVYVSFTLRHTGANMAWTILPLYMANLGASILAIGLMSFLNTGTQAILLRRLGRFKSQSLVTVGLFLSVLVFVAYPMASNYLQVVPIQIMLGFAWSTLYLGCLKSLGEKNVEKATSTGLLYSSQSLAAIIGPVLCGLLPSINNYAYVMGGAALIALLGFVVDNLKKTIN